MTQNTMTPAVQVLLAAFPKARIVETAYRISAKDFAAQKAKQLARKSSGGAIGVIWLEDGTVPLVSRSGLHTGWALPGGTVEQGESYIDTFEREMLEEVGVHIDTASLSLAVLERRIWTSPTGEQLRMDMAVFEANALPGETARQTAEATEEGLTVQSFSVDKLPTALIFADKEKIEQAAKRRQQNSPTWRP